MNLNNKIDMIETLFQYFNETKNSINKINNLQSKIAETVEHTKIYLAENSANPKIQISLFENESYSFTLALIRNPFLAPEAQALIIKYYQSIKSNLRKSFYYTDMLLLNQNPNISLENKQTLQTLMSSIELKNNFKLKEG